jgi:hypothetical protein
MSIFQKNLTNEPRRIGAKSALRTWACSALVVLGFVSFASAVTIPFRIYETASNPFTHHESEPWEGTFEVTNTSLDVTDTNNITEIFVDDGRDAATLSFNPTEMFDLNFNVFWHWREMQETSMLGELLLRSDEWSNGDTWDDLRGRTFALSTNEFSMGKKETQNQEGGSKGGLISFTTIPEPGSTALLALTGLLVAARLRRI